MKVELFNNEVNIKGRRKIQGNDIEQYILDLAMYANLDLVSNEYSGKGDQFYSIKLNGTNDKLYGFLIMVQNASAEAHYTIG